MPNAKDKETHLSYGWVKLKKGKMSSRLGNVILGEWLLDEIKKEIFKLVKENKNIKNKEETAKRISLAAVKYSILKCGLKNEIVFDIKESINLSGNSGPYLLYTRARINSIIRKSKVIKSVKSKVDLKNLIEGQEQSLIMKLAKYPETVKKAGENYDPSELAKYLFELAQEFNNYYHSVPILKTEEKTMAARLVLISSISQVIKNGLGLLGIETVEEM